MAQLLLWQLLNHHKLQLAVQKYVEIGVYLSTRDCNHSGAAAASQTAEPTLQQGGKWKTLREWLQQPLSEAHLTECWTLGSYTFLAPFLRCNVGSLSPTHFLGMVPHGCVHNSVKNATEICRMGVTADDAKPLNNTHCSTCSINKKILIQVITLLLLMKKSPITLSLLSDF